MPQAIIDPDEVRRFAARLSDMSESIRAKKADASSSFASLGDVWRDQKYTQFEQVFSETTAHLERFLRDAQNYAQYLRKKAEKADRYLDNRY